MPKEYTQCVRKYVEDGLSERTAKARCAAMFYKRHKMTVNEYVSKYGHGEKQDYDEELADAILYAMDMDIEAELKTLPINNNDMGQDQVVAFNEERWLVANELEDGIFEIVATKVGAAAFTSDGLRLTWTDTALQHTAPTWTGGRVNINHDSSRFYGKILSSWYQPPKVHIILKADKLMCTYLRLAKALRIGVSIEATEVKYNSDTLEIITAKGTDVAIVLPPHEPACSPEEGCGFLGREGNVAASGEEANEDTDETASTDSNVVEETAEVEKTEAIGESMSNDEPMVSQKEHEAVVNELEAMKKEAEELRAFRETREKEDKEAILEVVASYIPNDAFKEESLKTLCAVTRALKAYKEKMDNEPLVDSGANTTSTETQDVQKEHDALMAEIEGATKEDVEEFLKARERYQEQFGKEVK